MPKETYDYCMDEFDKIDQQSALKYLRGFVRRKEFTEKQLRRITCKTLIICGEFSRIKDETIAFQKIMPREYTTFVLMSDTGFLLTESCPQKLCSSIDLFVQSLVKLFIICNVFIIQCVYYIYLGIDKDIVRK